MLSYHTLILFISIMIEYGISLQLNRLVTDRWVDGWDDLRLMTLAGLCRRGVTSTAVNVFIRGIGITRRFGKMILSISKSLNFFYLVYFEG
jgi:glutamyl/glutaminyl-tRNA synthetase